MTEWTRTARDLILEHEATVGLAESHERALQSAREHAETTRREILRLLRLSDRRILLSDDRAYLAVVSDRTGEVVDFEVEPFAKASEIALTTAGSPDNRVTLAETGPDGTPLYLFGVFEEDRADTTGRLDLALVWPSHEALAAWLACQEPSHRDLLRSRGFHEWTVRGDDLT